MAGLSLWKRFGDWLRRSQSATNSQEVMHVDAEGTVVTGDPQNDPSQDEPVTLAPPSKKKNSMILMEENFSRLVDALEGLNHNVLQQQQKNIELVQTMHIIRDGLSSVSENMQQQGKAILEIAQSTKNQSLSTQQLVELTKLIPDLTRQQIDKLDDIRSELEQSSQSHAETQQTLKQFDQSVQTIVHNSKAQAVSLANMGQVLEDNQQKIAHEMIKQNRRFGWLLGIVLAITLLAVGVLAFLVIFSGSEI